MIRADFRDVEVLMRARKPSKRRFAYVQRYKLRNRYFEAGTTNPYDFDLVVTPFADAVVVVLFFEPEAGKVRVGLRHGLRPAVALRRDYIAPSGRDSSALFLELVAGGVEAEDYDSSDFVKAVIREVREEAGFIVSAAEVVRLGSSSFSAPGFSFEKIHYYCVKVDPEHRSPAGGDGHPLEEVQDIIFIDLFEAIEQCRDGRIADNKTEVGLLRFASWFGSLPLLGC